MKKKSDTLQQKVFLILDIKSNRKGILIMNALDVKKTDSAILSQDQKEIVFENMSDGIMMINEEGIITYCNSACEKIFGYPKESITEHSFRYLFLSNRKNRAFNKYFKKILDKGILMPTETLKYQTAQNTQYLTFHTSPLKATDCADQKDFSGLFLLIEDVSERYQLKQHEHDCAFIFAGLIICISLYLFAWSLIRFTLHIPLKTSAYTLMIEGMTFLLFLEILFLTSLSMRDIGLIPKLSTLKRNFIETILIGVVACIALLLTKVVLILLGHPIKDYFIGGSLHGAYIYLFTAFFQEFLARGVIQTSVKSLMKVKYQKQISIFLTSLLFSLMHLPFGFVFMMGALLLSLALGTIFERHENLWGCAILHWGCGYLAMSLFF